ncbi:hypothetical protein Q9S71_07935 [Microbacterium sp. KSW4-11]|uniref:Ig-like domain-containing protein n=1 Tax=Microbacterium gawkjiense TaxID=3067309 RepID=A0ABU3GAB0_9MICO|nr:hypothetical protein [Microbacterium sp. KSW4-11]MDT3316754.1 hypothetical protein [Microbacterium sp. KSW4-11]
MSVSARKIRGFRAAAVAIATALVASVLTLGGGSAATAATVSEVEPNNEMAAANLIALGDTVSASSLTASYYDDDWYAVDIPQAGRVTFDVRFPRNLTGHAYDFEVYDAAGDQRYAFDLNALDYDGKALRDSATYLSAGRAFIHVYGRNNRDSWGASYSLSVTSKAGYVETEGNGEQAAADLISLGKTVSGSSLTASYYDDDWYAVDIPQTGRVTFDVRFPRNLTGHAYDFEVYDAAGDQRYAFDLNALDYDGKALRDSATYLSAGRAFIHVYGRNNRDSWGASYSLSVTSKAGYVETEGNGEQAAADLISLGKTVSGSSLTASYYDDDWYAVRVPSAGPLVVDLRGPRGTSGSTYDVELYDAIGNSLFSADLDSVVNTGSWLAAQRVTAPKGYVYLRVYSRNNRMTWGKTYTLTISQKLAKTPTPSISGSPRVGKALTAEAGTWAPSGVKVSYQWLRNGKPIAKATSSTYKVVAADAGTSLSVRTTGSKSGYVSVTRTSKAVKPLYSFTTAPTPTISGLATVGKKLTAKPGTWAPATVTLSYRWLRDGKAISGAVKSTYTLTKADRGKKISVEVTATKKLYATTSKTSKPITVR